MYVWMYRLKGKPACDECRRKTMSDSARAAKTMRSKMGKKEEIVQVVSRYLQSVVTSSSQKAAQEKRNRWDGRMDNERDYGIYACR